MSATGATPPSLCPTIDVPVPHETLGHSGFHARGLSRANTRPKSASSPTATSNGWTVRPAPVSSSGTTATAATAAAAPGDTPVCEHMSAVERQVRGLLLERQRRNDEALTALTGARGTAGSATSIQRSTALQPSSSSAQQGSGHSRSRPLSASLSQAPSARSCSPNLSTDAPSASQPRNPSPSIRLPLRSAASPSAASTGRRGGALLAASAARDGGGSGSSRASSASPTSPSARASTPGGGSPWMDYASSSRPNSGRPASGSRLRSGPPDVSGGPGWGVSEGGRDGLGWVRNLVRFTETHPINVSDERSSDVTPDPEGGFKRTVFPSLKPNRREDAALLKMWLETMMAQVQQGALLAFPGSSYNSESAQLVQQQLQAGLPPGLTAAGSASKAQAQEERVEGVASSPLELTEGALHVYGVAFKELQRQVGSDCRERGELLGTLWEHYFPLVELRASLVREERLQGLQEAIAEVQASKESLEQNVKALVDKEADTVREHQAALAGAASHARAMAAKYTATQHEADELARNCQVVDVTLKEEVHRRLEAEELVAKAKEEAHRARFDADQARGQRQQLEREVTSLQARIQELEHDLDLAEVARQTAHEQTRDHLQERAAKEVEMMCVKGQYETDGIVVASLEQQVKELQGHLAQVKGHARYHLKHVGNANERVDALLERIRLLERQLEEGRAEQARLQGELAGGQAAVQAATETLKNSEAEWGQQRQDLEKTAAARDARLAELSTDVRQLTSKLHDTELKLTARESSGKSLEAEVAALRETMLQFVAGREGAPAATDAGWGTLGSAGALQKSAAVVARQLDALASQVQALGLEKATLEQRLADAAVAHKMQAKDAYEARTAQTVAVREATAARQDQSDQQQKMQQLEEDKEQLTLLLQEAKGASEKLQQAIEDLHKSLAYYRPFEALLQESETFRKEGLVKQAALEEELALARKDIKGLHEAQDMLKKELAGLVRTNHELSENARELTATKQDLHEMTISKNAAADESDLLRNRMEDALGSAAQALERLSVSSFLLQGVADSTSLRSSSVAAGATLLPVQLGLVPSTGAGPVGASSHSFRAHSARMPSPTGTSSPGDAEAGGGRKSRFDRAPGRLLRPATARAGSTAADPPSPSDRQLGPQSADGVSDCHETAASEQLYGIAVSPDMETLLGERGVGEAIEARRRRWLSIKVQILAYFSSRLREKLRLETQRRAELEVELLRREVATLEDAKQQEEGIIELVVSLRAVLAHATADVRRDMDELHGILPDVRALLDALTNGNGFIGGLIAALQAKLQAKVPAETQTEDAVEAAWQRLIAALPMISPSSPPSPRTAFATAAAAVADTNTGTFSDDPASASPLPSPPASPSRSFSGAGLLPPFAVLSETIVRIYVRTEASLSGDVSSSAWGPRRKDTVYDAVMAHFQAGAATFNATLLQDLDSPLALLLRSCRAYRSTTRVAMFAYFLGLWPDEVQWGQSAWHLFTQVLHTLRLLMGATWRSTVRQWATPQGVTLHMQVAMDLCINAFNAQGARDLDGGVTARLAALAIPGPAGAVVDMDALLLLLVNEYNQGNCPRDPMLYPRRQLEGSASAPASGPSSGATTALAAAVQGLLTRPNSRPASPASRVVSRPASAAIWSSSGAGFGSQGVLSSPRGAGGAVGSRPQTGNSVLGRGGR